jgi:hypothetical protein
MIAATKADGEQVARLRSPLQQERVTKKAKKATDLLFHPTR